MHPSLKNVTERAQKYDFSVNIPIYIAYNSPRPDSQKVDIKRHCVFPLYTSPTFCVRKLTVKPIIVLKKTFHFKT